MEKISYRYERKFLISAFDEHEAENMIQLHPAFFRETYPPRFINNIYLDSQRYDNFFDNVEGAPQRCKVRIRWYGDLLGKIRKPVLEFKIKNGLLGSKKQFILTPFLFDKEFNISSLQKIFRGSEFPMAEKVKLIGLMPTLVNCYKRKYYEALHGKFRITVDSHMAYWQIDLYGNLLLSNKVDEQHIVVELKYDKVNDHEARNISNFFPFRMTKSSKYVRGLNMLHENFPV